MKNPINSVGRLFSYIRELIKESNKRTRVENIRKSFYIEERGGVIFLVHNGIAVSKCDGSYKSEDITLLLKCARDTAVEFEYKENT